MVRSVQKISFYRTGGARAAPGIHRLVTGDLPLMQVIVYSIYSFIVANSLRHDTLKG